MLFTLVYKILQKGFIGDRCKDKSEEVTRGGHTL